jgi:pimeloyl-ACP methyl ester carboxylesterase
MPTNLSIPRLVLSADATTPDAYLVHRGPGAPVMIAVHGISRNAAEMAKRFADNPAFRHWTIVAPLFEKGRFGQYQQMLAKPGQQRSDLALLRLLDQLNHEWGVEADKIYLFGFSGGAQFVHRFALLYPERVAAVVAVSAGWYVMPDTQAEWPYGIGSGCPRPVTLADALAVPMTIAVGEQDLRLDGSVRQSPQINMIQGETRVRRAKRWSKAMNFIANELHGAPSVELKLLAGGVHDFGSCVQGTALMQVTAGAFANAHTTGMAVSA